MNLYYHLRLVSLLYRSPSSHPASFFDILYALNIPLYSNFLYLVTSILMFQLKILSIISACVPSLINFLSLSLLLALRVQPRQLLISCFPAALISLVTAQQLHPLEPDVHKARRVCPAALAKGHQRNCYTEISKRKIPCPIHVSVQVCICCSN